MCLGNTDVNFSVKCNQRPDQDMNYDIIVDSHNEHFYVAQTHFHCRRPLLLGSWTVVGLKGVVKFKTVKQVLERE